MTITTGTLIEYIDGGKFICALVTQDSGKRLRLVNQNGREVALPLSRVLIGSQATFDVNAGRDAHKELLQNAARKRRELAEEIALEEVWEIACEEEQDEFSARFLAELLFDENLTDDQAAAFLRAVFADRFFFKFKNGVVIVHTPEQVEHIRHQLEKEREKEKPWSWALRSWVKL